MIANLLGRLARLNRALAELFSSFTIFRELPEETGRIQVDGSDVGWFREEFEDALRPGGAAIYVFPNLRREVFWRLVADYDENEEIPEPPMEWIEALAKSADTSCKRLKT